MRAEAKPFYPTYLNLTTDDSQDTPLQQNIKPFKEICTTVNCPSDLFKVIEVEKVSNSNVHILELRNKYLGGFQTSTTPISDPEKIFTNHDHKNHLVDFLSGKETESDEFISAQETIEKESEEDSQCQNC